MPKTNGEFRKSTIINLFDWIVQQAVYQIISPLLEEQMSKHSYGLRKGIVAKVPVSKLDTILNKSKDIYTSRVFGNVHARFWVGGKDGDNVNNDIYQISDSKFVKQQ